MKIKNALNDIAEVTINETKPRKGSFVVQIEGEEDQPVIEFLNLTRPFTKLKELDLDEAIQTIRDRLNER